MIIESIMFALTSIVLGSLYFSNKILKLQKEELEKIERELNPEKHNKLRAFIHVFIGQQCPLCGYECTADKGLGVPQACSKSSRKKNCNVNEEHMHVACTACDGSWLMEPRIKML
jgi:hypothetical protein